MTTEMFQRRRLAGLVSVATAISNIDDPSIAFGDTAAVFKGWGNAAMSLAVWRREPPPDIGEQLKELRPVDLSGWCRGFDVARARSIIVEAMAGSGFREPALERYLAADMTLLTRIFSSSTGTSQIEARLDIVRDDACRRFHMDSYPSRLAVTYIGPGTVWVPRCHAEQALAEQDTYSGPIFEIPAFSAGLFAGEHDGRTGLVHRSPRIAGTGRTRLFFCVNAARH